ncbi:STAS domain-containing protein [Streptomyces fructofermentans]|uniref:STAS domain-containing protein n=1 Tax=Streptomyces fructofermentans TaxID=152141 RepID=A0A918NPK3_9ACTN|nr:STAS domain-containing protein [Streptomyces fructofermentans]GGX85155.1 hypothetical protein GCM10010515_60750 [Streptomyces fructofermentans]
MTPNPPPFTLTVETHASWCVVRVAGDLDYETCDELVDTVVARLTGCSDLDGPPSDLRLNFAELHSVDSMGLSALLMIRRRTDRAGVRLHLDERPGVLERLLDMTGTLGYLTAPCRHAAGHERPGTG